MVTGQVDVPVSFGGWSFGGIGCIARGWDSRLAPGSCSCYTARPSNWLLQCCTVKALITRLGSRGQHRLDRRGGAANTEAPTAGAPARAPPATHHGDAMRQSLVDSYPSRFCEAASVNAWVDASQWEGMSRLRRQMLRTHWACSWSLRLN